jgi:hypothetical protein
MAVWTHIAHDSLSLPASSVTWSSIPTDGTYDHLCIKISGRSDDVQYYDHLGIQFNGDTGTNYSDTYIYCGSSALGSSRSTTYNHISHLYGVTAASNLADTFGTMTVWVPHYANSTNFKQVIGSGAVENNSTTDYQWIQGVNAGLWQDTSAITDILVYPAQGSDDWVAYSTFDLYGIKGA